MKFSLVCLIPASLWTVLATVYGAAPNGSDQQIGGYIITAVLWFGTVAVLGLYWAARIVRHVMRGDRG